MSLVVTKLPTINLGQVIQMIILCMCQYACVCVSIPCPPMLAQFALRMDDTQRGFTLLQVLQMILCESDLSPIVLRALFWHVCASASRLAAAARLCLLVLTLASSTLVSDTLKVSVLFLMSPVLSLV